MANSQLYDKTYKIPPDILNSIRVVLISHPTGIGVDRAKFLVKNGKLSYSAMKRIKHDLETNANDKVQYALAGGNLMLSFINRMLNADRAAVSREHKIKQPIIPNVNSELQPGTYSLSEEVKKQIRNAIVIIVNGDHKILLLKRIVLDGYWGSGQWGFVGGEINKGEKPEEGARRETNEETGLVLGKFIKRFTIQRDSNETEYIFVTKYDGDGTNVKLNYDKEGNPIENTDYGWFGVDEMKELDTVPHLKEYLVLAFKEY